MVGLMVASHQTEKIYIEINILMTYTPHKSEENHRLTILSDNRGNFYEI
jgi:hypothetical protein